MWTEFSDFSISSRNLYSGSWRCWVSWAPQPKIGVYRVRVVRMCTKKHFRHSASSAGSSNRVQMRIYRGPSMGQHTQYGEFWNWSKIDFYEILIRILRLLRAAACLWLTFTAQASSLDRRYNPSCFNSSTLLVRIRLPCYVFIPQPCCAFVSFN